MTRRQRRRARGPVSTVTTALVMTLLSGSGVAVGINVHQLWWTNQVAAAEHGSTVEDLREAFDAHRTQDAFEADRMLQAASDGLTRSTVLGGLNPWIDPVAAQQDARLRLESALYEPGTPLGVVHVPRFGEGFASPMISGVDDHTLRSGIGWNPEGARPGESGNLGLAGHRSTWGKPLERITELEVGDPIVVETASGWFTYTVVGHEVVEPTSTEVWAAVPRRPDSVADRAWATLVACHPYGSDAQRWITYAQLSAFDHRDDGPPDVLG